MPTDYTDPIDDYLEGNLPPQDRAAFEQRLAQEPELREEVDLQRRINAELAQRADDDRYRELIHRAKMKHAPPPSVRSRFIRRRWWLVAAVLLFAVVALLVVQPWRESPQQLAIRYGALNQPIDYLAPAYRQPRDAAGAASSLADRNDPVAYARTLVGIDTSVEAALQAYLDIPEARLDDSLRFETALLYLADRQPVPALELLNRLSTAWEDDRLWYSALAHLQLGDAEAARQAIQSLLRSEDFTPYRREARQLLNDLGGETE